MGVIVGSSSSVSISCVCINVWSSSILNICCFCLVSLLVCLANLTGHSHAKWLYSLHSKHLILSLCTHPRTWPRPTVTSTSVISPTSILSFKWPTPSSIISLISITTSSIIVISSIPLITSCIIAITTSMIGTICHSTPKILIISQMTSILIIRSKPASIFTSILTSTPIWLIHLWFKWLILPFIFCY